MIRVAVFEPEQDIRELVAVTLKYVGSCDIVVQSGGWQLIEDTLASTNIDVLYARIEPKWMDLERIVKLRETYLNLGIVIYANFYTNEEVIEAGADIRLSKPIDPKIIVDAVQLAYAKHK